MSWGKDSVITNDMTKNDAKVLLSLNEPDLAGISIPDAVKYWRATNEPYAAKGVSNTSFGSMLQLMFVCRSSSSLQALQMAEALGA